MEKLEAFLISIILTFMFALNYFMFFAKDNKEEMIVKRVIDGDTLVLENDLRVRLLNINTPEKNSRNFNFSTNFLKKYENEVVLVELLKKDKYGRFLARIYTPEYLNLMIVREGLANKFLVSPEEEKEFAKAEKSAIENSKGYWSKSKYFNCLSSEIIPEKEIIVLKNKCKSISFYKWSLKDEGRKTYIFRNLTIYNSIRIHTNKGKDNEKDIFLNIVGEMWNNDRDSLYIFDEEEKIAHYNYYGY